MRILIADDHEIIRSSVVRVLQSCADVEECAEATRTNCFYTKRHIAYMHTQRFTLSHKA
jgi:DNA-binding NarL/FixJ family response regulator